MREGRGRSQQEGEMRNEGEEVRARLRVSGGTSGRR